MDVSATEVILHVSLGVMVTMNQRLEADTLLWLLMNLVIKLNFQMQN
jgi:hypothetical protein